MSATMDVDEFSAYFNKAPVFFLEGRQFNVDVFHSEAEQSDYLFSSISSVLQLQPIGRDYKPLRFYSIGPGQEERKQCLSRREQVCKRKLKRKLT